RVLYVASGREVVERLKHRVLEPHDLMDRVIEKTADPRRADSGRLRLQIKYLADHPRLPEKSAVEPRSMPPQARFEFRDHPQGKRAVSGNILIAADLGGQFSRIAGLGRCPVHARRGRLKQGRDSARRTSVQSSTSTMRFPPG